MAYGERRHSERRFSSGYGGGGGYGGERRFERNFGSVPVKVGDELDVTIEAVGEKGDGIAKKDGFVLFVPNAREGDRIKVRVTKVLRKVGFAEKVGEAEASESAPEASSESDSDSGEASEDGQPEATEDFGEEQESEPMERLE